MVKSNGRPFVALNERPVLLIIHWEFNFLTTQIQIRSFNNVYQITCFHAVFSLENLSKN